jgi:hypothetical protein
MDVGDSLRIKEAVRNAFASSTIAGVSSHTSESERVADATSPRPTASEIAGSPLIENLSIRVTDLLRTDDDLWIRDVTFRNCVLRGPAVIYPRRCEIRRVAFDAVDADIRSVWWLFPNQKVFGVIGFDNCQLLDCTTDNLAFLTDEQGLEDVIRSLRS